MQRCVSVYGPAVHIRVTFVCQDSRNIDISDHPPGYEHTRAEHLGKMIGGSKLGRISWVKQAAATLRAARPERHELSTWPDRNARHDRRNHLVLTCSSTQLRKRIAGRQISSKRDQNVVRRGLQNATSVAKHRRCD